MKFIPIKTRPFLPPKDSIYPILDASLPKVRDGDILFITSKVLAIHQGRCVKIKKSQHDNAGSKKNSTTGHSDNTRNR